MSQEKKTPGEIAGDTAERIGSYPLYFENTRVVEICQTNDPPKRAAVKSQIIAFQPSALPGGSLTGTYRNRFLAGNNSTVPLPPGKAGG